MGIISYNVFKLEYKDSRGNEDVLLIEADDMPDALAIFKAKYPSFSVIAIRTFMPVYRRTTKTVTIAL